MWDGLTSSAPLPHLLCYTPLPTLTSCRHITGVPRSLRKVAPNFTRSGRETLGTPNFLVWAVVNAEIDTVLFHRSAKLLNHLLFLSRTPTTWICIPTVPMALELRISSLALCGTDLCGFFFFSPYQRRMCKLASLASFLLILLFFCLIC